MANQVLRCDASAGDAYVEYDLGGDNGIIWTRFNMWIPAAARAFFEANPNAVFLELLDASHVVQEQAWIQADGISTTPFGGSALIKTPADGWHSYISSYDYLDAGGGYHWGDRFSKDSRVSFASGLSTIGTEQIRYVRLGVKDSGGDPDAVLFFEQFRVATAYHLNDVAGIDNDDVWALTDYEGGFFGPGSDAGTTVVGDCTIVDDPNPLEGGEADYTLTGAATEPDPNPTFRPAEHVSTPFDSEIGDGLGHFINRIRNGGADGKTDVALLNTFFDSVADEIAVAGADEEWAGAGAPFGNGAFDAVWLPAYNHWVVAGDQTAAGATRAIATSPDLTPDSFTYRDLGSSAYSQVFALAYDEDADILVAVGTVSDDDFGTWSNVNYSTDGGITWTPVSTIWDESYLYGGAAAFSPALGLWAIAGNNGNYLPVILTAPDPTDVWTPVPTDWDVLGAFTDLEWLPGIGKFALLGSVGQLDGVNGNPLHAVSLSADGAAWTHPQTAFDGGPGTPDPGTAGTAFGIVETPDGIYLVGWSNGVSTFDNEAVLALSTDDGDTFGAALNDLGSPLSDGTFNQAGTAICYRTDGDVLWVGGGAILDDEGIVGPMVRMALTTPEPGERRGLCIAPTAAWDDPNPEWVRLDGLEMGGVAAARRLTSWKVDRGRSRELDRTEAGTSEWDIIDRDGMFDTTVETGLAGEGGFDPLRQAQVMLPNPARDTESAIFTGYIDELEVEMDVGARRADVQLSLVDAFGVMADLEMHPTSPPRFGTTPALQSAAQIYFPPTDADPDYNGTWGQEVNARIHRALDQAGWDSTRRRIASGNENLQGAVYGRYDSLLAVIFDAAEAEFPGGIANAYMSKDGIACFHGRYLRFNANAYLADRDEHRRHGHPLVRWKVGGAAAAAAADDVALLSRLKFTRSLSDIYNVATVLPQNVEISDVPGALIKNDTSIERFGWRPISFEDLLVLRGVTSGLTAVEECKNFARFYVTNYKDPKTRVTQLVFRPRDARSFSGPATWDLMCGVDIGDPIDLDTEHWGGLGGFHERYFVEGIHYEADASGRPDMPNVTLTLDVSPASFWAYNPFD